MHGLNPYETLFCSQQELVKPFTCQLIFKIKIFIGVGQSEHSLWIEEGRVTDLPIRVSVTKS